MTMIYYWCPLRQAYVSMLLPIEVAFKLARFK